MKDTVIALPSLWS